MHGKNKLNNGSAPANSTPLSKLQLSALQFIELTLIWEGQINSSDLINKFQLSRSTASQLIGKYKEICPHNLVYDASSKAYQATANFTARFSSASLDAYLALKDSEHTYIERLSSSLLIPSSTLMPPIMQAINQQQRLDIRYASIKCPTGEERIVSPHSLINDGQRWHVRAWCEKSQGYRDFVLSRIRQVFGLEGQAEKNCTEDVNWNTWVNFNIEPDPRFPQETRELIALDYGMQFNAELQKYQRLYKVRGALVIYWLQHLRLDIYRETPEAQQIILSPESRTAVNSWLPS